MQKSIAQTKSKNGTHFAHFAITKTSYMLSLLEVYMMFFSRREPTCVAALTYYELRLVLAAMIVFRNKVLELDGPTEDIDSMIIKLQKAMK